MPWEVCQKTDETSKCVHKGATTNIIAGWQILLDEPTADGVLKTVVETSKGTPHYFVGQVPHEDQVQYNPTPVVETPTVNIDELPLPPCSTGSISQRSKIDEISSPK